MLTIIQFTIKSENPNEQRKLKNITKILVKRKENTKFNT